MPGFSSDQIAPVLQGTNKLVWFCKLKRLEKFPNPKPSPRTPHPDGMKVSLGVIIRENVDGIHKYFRGGRRGRMKSLVQEILLAWPMRSSNHRPSLTPMSFAVSLIRVGIRVCPNNYTEFSSCSFFFESFQKIPQSDDVRRRGYKIIIKQRIQKEYRRGNKLALKALRPILKLATQVISVITQALWVNKATRTDFTSATFTTRCNFHSVWLNLFYQASVVQKMDTAIDWINHYPVNKYCFVQWIVT